MMVMKDNWSDPKYRAAWKSGALAAADVADNYNGSSTHTHRLGDCIAAKLNLRSRKPRRNGSRLVTPNDAMIRGVVLGVAVSYMDLDAPHTGCAFTPPLCVTVPSCRRRNVHCTTGPWWFAFVDFCGCHVHDEGPFDHEPAAINRQRYVLATKNGWKTKDWTPILTRLYRSAEDAINAAEAARRHREPEPPSPDVCGPCAARCVG